MVGRGDPAEIAQHCLDDRGRGDRAGQALEDPGERLGLRAPGPVTGGNRAPMEPGCAADHANKGQHDDPEGLGLAGHDHQAGGSDEEAE